MPMNRAPLGDYTMHSGWLDEDLMPTFPQFSNLPIEIRLKIWANALPGARVIPINLSIKHHHITSCTSPVLLRVCQESRNLALTLYHRGFTTTQYPYGILICPAIDIIFLRKPCRSSPIHECDDCTNFELGLRLQRYDDTDVAQTIAFHESLLEREAYDNMSHIHENFRAIENIVVRVDCNLDEFRHVRGGIEDEIQNLFQLVKNNSPSMEESLEVIRVTAINYMDDLLDCDWEEPDLFYLNQHEIEQQKQKYRQWDWEDAMDFHFPKLSPEDRRRRCQDFVQLSPEDQEEHLQRILDLEDDEDSTMNFLLNN